MGLVGSDLVDRGVDCADDGCEVGADLDFVGSYRGVDDADGAGEIGPTDPDDCLFPVFDNVGIGGGAMGRSDSTCCLGDCVGVVDRAT